MKQPFLYLLLLTAAVSGVFVASCKGNENKVYQQFKEVKTQGWEWKEPRAFEFDIEEDGYFYNINLDLRITGSYGLSNIWLLYKVSGKGLDHENQVEIPLADNTGKWLGKGQGNLLTYSKIIFANKKLEKGHYKIVVNQNTREEILSGVSDIGVSVTKTNKAL